MDSIFAACSKASSNAFGFFRPCHMHYRAEYHAHAHLMVVASAMVGRPCDCSCNGRAPATCLCSCSRLQAPRAASSLGVPCATRLARSPGSLATVAAPVRAVHFPGPTCRPVRVGVIKDCVLTWCTQQRSRCSLYGSLTDAVFSCVCWPVSAAPAPASRRQLTSVALAPPCEASHLSRGSPARSFSF